MEQWLARWADRLGWVLVGLVVIGLLTLTR
jgi:hypothetical protein